MKSEIVVVIGAVVVLSMAFYSVKSHHDFDKKCRAAGGTPIHTRESGMICMRDAIEVN